MSDDFQALVMKHVTAVTRLLLGDKGIQPSVAILGIEPLDDTGRRGLAHMAAASQTDIVALEFGPLANGRVEIVGVNVVVERDGRTFFQSDCRLWKNDNGRRGIILPKLGSRGHFRLTPQKILHIDGEPVANSEVGVERASNWLRARVRTSDPAPLGGAMFPAAKIVASRGSHT